MIYVPKILKFSGKVETAIFSSQMLKNGCQEGKN